MLRNQIMNRPAAPSPAPAGTFVPGELFGMLGNLSRADADSCDFGVIKLDDTGKVVMVNRYQSELGCVPVPNFEGKHYFTQIAPCTNNGLFYGTFRKGVAANSLNVSFPYTFTFKLKPTNVRVHMYRDPASKTNWVFCQRA
jgi:photoactive yellow protein